MSGNEKHDAIDGAAPEADLDDLLARVRRNIELDLRVSAPAKVVAYDPATQRTTLTLEFLAIRIVEGEEVPDVPLLLYNVPVRWPGGSLGYVTTPLVPGDTGRVCFADRCLSTWLNAKEPNALPLDPVNGRTHNLADAVFDPGLRQAFAPITPPTDLTATVIEGPLVKLGRAATQPVALAPLVQANLEALVAAIEAAPVAPLDGGATFKAALIGALSTWPTTVAATKTQAE